MLTQRKASGTRRLAAAGVSAWTLPAPGAHLHGGRKYALRVRAPIVVGAAGALHTPALLLRSRLGAGGNVGRNLRLHPATVATAVYPKARPPRPREPACARSPGWQRASCRRSAAASLCLQMQTPCVQRIPAAVSGSACTRDAGLPRCTPACGRAGGARSARRPQPRCARRGRAQDKETFYKYYIDMYKDKDFVPKIFETPFPNEPGDEPVRPVKMWEGSIFSVYSREAADWEGTGYGPLLMTPAVPPLGPSAALRAPCHAAAHPLLAAPTLAPCSGCNTAPLHPCSWPASLEQPPGGPSVHATASACPAWASWGPCGSLR